MKAIILAGGHDDNLAPLTLDFPTPTLPVGGKPLLARTVDYLERQGMTGAIVTCYRWPDRIERALAEYSGLLPVSTVLETSPFGTANILRQLAKHIHDRFVVVAGNILTDLDLRGAIQEHVKRGAIATVVVCEVGAPCTFGEVTADRNGRVVMVGSENLVRRAGKRTANTGIYILEPAVLRNIPTDRGFDLARDLLPRLVEDEQPVYASYQDGFWQEISSHEQYRTANLAVLERQVRDLSPAGREISAGLWLSEDAQVHPRAVLTPPLLVGRGCRIERDAVIGPNVVLGEGVRIERGGVVTQSVVLPGSRVGLATKLESAVVRGNVLARATSTEPIYVGDREVLELLEPPEFQIVVRSLIERMLALGTVILLSPVLLLIALLIKLDSPGPVFYSQLRVGQGRRTPGGQYQGRVFELLKFRTMFQDADRRLTEVLGQNEYGSAPFVKIKNDPRITWIGKFLRATSLDELPQLLNVIKGDMSLVGNRPLPLYEAEQLDDDWQRIRFNAPAGITGLWQISGRSDLSAEERLILDNYYALTRSLRSDLKILAVTIPALLARRGAR